MEVEEVPEGRGEHLVWQVTLLSLWGGWFFTGDTPEVGLTSRKADLQAALGDLGTCIQEGGYGFGRGQV